MTDHLYAVNEWAADYYQKMLQWPDALTYLRDRGISRTVAKQFRLGYAYSSGLVTEWKESGGSTLVTLSEVGLATLANGGDWFRNRLMIPICDVNGLVVGFAGRTMTDATPKYLNSRETALYHKSSALFGINHAVRTIRETGNAVVVEGYFDVLACHEIEIGITNVVASCGTALTREQVEILRELGARSLTLCFDSDPAGIAAANRAMDITEAAGVIGCIALLPDGCKDPADAMQKDPWGLRRCLNEGRETPNGWLVLTDMALGDVNKASDDASRREALERVLPILARIRIQTDFHINVVSGVLGISEAALKEDVCRLQQRGSSPPSPTTVDAEVAEILHIRANLRAARDAGRDVEVADLLRRLSALAQAAGGAETSSQP